MGFILTLTAYILLMVLSPIGFLWSAVTRPKKYFWNIAISLDQLGNVICADPMNYLLIQPYSKYKFGNPDETISSVLGKNQLHDRLKPFGKRVVMLLGKLDENHSIKSIENDEN